MRRFPVLVLAWLIYAGPAMHGVGGQTPPLTAEATGQEQDRSRPNVSDETVVAAVDGVPLYDWQVDLLLEYRIRSTRQAAIEYWVENRIKAREARRLQLDSGPKAAFILKFMEDHTLSTLLFRHLTRQVAPPTEDDVLAMYQQRADLFHKDMIVNLQMIVVESRDIAELITAEARKPASSFDALYARYSHQNDDRRGITGNIGVEKLKAMFPAATIAALRSATAGDILGPVNYGDGYAVIRVIHISPGRKIPFEKIKSGLMRSMRKEKVGDYLSEYYQDLRQNAAVFQNLDARSIPSSGRREAEGNRQQPRRRGEALEQAENGAGFQAK